MMGAISLFTLGLALAQPPAPPQLRTERILVVPFTNAQKEPRLAWLSEGAAVLVADELVSRGLAAIRRPERVRAFDRLNLPLSATLSRATIIKVGQLVGASEVVVGTYRLEGEQLAVEAHSIRIDTGRLQPHVRERAPLADLFVIFQRLAGKLSGAAPVTEKRAAAPPPGAFENYIKGLIAESAESRAEFLEAAIKEHAGFDRARLALWEVRHEQAEHEAALAVARSVPAGSSYARRARFHAGVSLMELERYDEAFSTLKGLLDELTSSGEGKSHSAASVLNNLGVLLIRRGASPQTGSAAYYLTQAADSDSADPDYRFNLGYAYALAQNHQGAVYWLRETVRRDPTDAHAHYVLALALDASGAAVEAARERELARQLSAEYETPPLGEKEIPKDLERLRTELESPRDLRLDQSIVNSAQRDQQDLAAFHLQQGRRFFEREQDHEALSELRKAVYLLPYEAEAHLLMGRIYLRGGRPEDAVDALKISLWSRDSAAARVALARAHLSLKNTGAARAELERALALDPESAEASELLASLK